MGWIWLPEPDGQTSNPELPVRGPGLLPPHVLALEDAAGRSVSPIQTAPVGHLPGNPWGSPWVGRTGMQEPPGAGFSSQQRDTRRVAVPVQVVATPSAPSSVRPSPAKEQIPVHAVSTAPLLVSNSLSMGAAVPESLLARIESVVSEMELDMTAERRHVPTGREEVSVDLLGQRLQALEKQRQAAELRSGQLAELRMIVAGRGQNGSHSISEDSLALRRKGRHGKEDGEASIGESHNISTVLTGSEVEDEADAQAAEDLLTQLEERFKEERNQLGLGESGASLRFHERLQQVMQAMLHKERVAEEHSVQQSQVAEAATQEQRATESDLQALEQHSETVLADCRALQARVKELEETCSGSGYRHAKRASELEEKLKSADAVEQELRAELEEMMKQLELTRAKEAALHEELSQSQADCQHLTSKGAAEKDRLKVLERDHEDMIAIHARQQQLLKQQVVDLQKELAETQEREQLYARQHGHMKGASAGLEGQLAHAEKQAAESAQLHAESKLQLQTLEQRLAEAESATSDHKQRHSLVHSQFQDTERELEKATAAHRRSEEEIAELCERLETLEEELRVAHEAEQRLSKQATAASQASSEQIACLEGLLAEEQEARAQIERLHDETVQVHQSSAGDLETQMVDIKADLSFERECSQALRLQLRDAEELAEQVRMDAEDALRKQDESRRKMEEVAEERCNDLREHVANLEGMLEKERSSNLFRPRTVSIASRASDDLPPRQQAVLEQVEQQGWNSVAWRDGYTMLHWAASKGKVDLLRRLLSLNGDPDAVDKFDRTALQCAEEAKNSEAADFLRRHTRPKTEKLARSIKKRQTALPSSGQSSAFVSSIASRRPSDPTDLSSSAQAAETELPELYWPVLEEIDRRGWSNMTWAHGFTLLHWAAKNNSPGLVERFLLQGADPLQEDEFGRTALDYAHESSSASVVAAFARHVSGSVKKRSIDLRNLGQEATASAASSGLGTE
mmetsp:Transcript_78648/g.138688  ORF Transcript_78648/g.138688 Transcript_78648/m.138688 type:complete len:976 (-) Transcript_78648:110-3037(-)